MKYLVVLTVILATVSARAGEIADNSFLIEEAYNQEPKVIQHISLWVMDRETNQWEYAFTEEWPIDDEKNQISLTLGMVGKDRAYLSDGWVNYRRELYHSEDGGAVVSPRLSLGLPVGDATSGRGDGVSLVQVNVPVSLQVWRLALHTNVGLTTPLGDAGGGPAPSFTVGQSVIGLVLPWFNVLVEALWTQTPSRPADERDEVWINPGARAAINVSSDLQIVVGASMPIGFAAAKDMTSILGYLSIEHGLP